MPSRSALTRFLTTPENRSALIGIQELLHGLASEVGPNPLYIHGPAGCGKSHLIRILTEVALNLDCSLCVMSANDFAETDAFAIPEEARHADLLVVEDLQHLPTRFAATLIGLMNERLTQQLAMVFTAVSGPGQLCHRGTAMPRGLTSRLVAGLIVGIEPMGAPSRRCLLDRFAEEASVKIAPDILDWLAQHLTAGGRQLEGAVAQWKALQRLQKKPLRLEDIREHFHAQVEATTPTVERITEHVGACYDVHPKQLRSAKRTREVLLPRQLSMYLARQLTKLSLQQIGRYFGGRDHKTVQHACQKVEAAIQNDRTFSGIVRRMHAELA